MYECNRCNNLYDLPDQADKLFKFVTPDIDIEFVLRCPFCKTKKITGGEFYWDEIGNQRGIMLFGREYNDHDDHNLPMYLGKKVHPTPV